jgi:hypothetical protein
MDRKVVAREYLLFLGLLALGLIVMPQFLPFLVDSGMFRKSLLASKQRDTTFGEPVSVPRPQSRFGEPVEEVDPQFRRMPDPQLNRFGDEVVEDFGEPVKDGGLQFRMMPDPQPNRWLVFCKALFDRREWRMAWLVALGPYILVQFLRSIAWATGVSVNLAPATRE